MEVIYAEDFEMLMNHYTDVYGVCLDLAEYTSAKKGDIEFLMNKCAHENMSVADVIKFLDDNWADILYELVQSIRDQRWYDLIDKKHDKLISANKLKLMLSTIPMNRMVSMRTLITLLDDMDEEDPVKHNHWILNEQNGCTPAQYECSFCGYTVEAESRFRFGDCEELDYAYCPYCGSKMDYEDDEEETVSEVDEDEDSSVPRTTRFYWSMCVNCSYGKSGCTFCVNDDTSPHCRNFIGGSCVCTQKPDEGETECKYFVARDDCEQGKEN